MEKDPLVMVLITAPDLAIAKKIARALVAGKIAACVNIVPGLISVYTWEGEQEEDQELLLMVKTREGLLEEKLIPLVQDLHPYDLPEIISLPINGGSRSYLNWIQKETSGDLS